MGAFQTPKQSALPPLQAPSQATMPPPEGFQTPKQSALPPLQNPAQVPMPPPMTKPPPQASLLAPQSALPPPQQRAPQAAPLVTEQPASTQTVQTVGLGNFPFNMQYMDLLASVSRLGGQVLPNQNACLGGPSAAVASSPAAFR